MLCLLALSLLGSCHQNNELSDDLIKQYRTKEREAEVLNSLWDFSIKFNSTKINPDVIIENFYSGWKIRIGDFLKKRKVLILQYSELNCNTCIDSAVTQFIDFSKEKNNRLDLMLIASSTNRRLMANFVHLNNWELSNLFIDIIDFYDKCNHNIIRREKYYRLSDFITKRNQKDFLCVYIL